MPLWQASAARQSRIASAAPEASPRRMSRLEQRAQAEALEQARVAGLGRAVGGPDVVERARARAPGAPPPRRRRRSRRAAPGRGSSRAASERAGHRRDLAPAEPAQDLERVAERAGVAHEAAPDHRGLVGEAMRGRGRCRARSTRPPARRTARRRSPPPTRCCRCPSRPAPAGRGRRRPPPMPALSAATHSASLIAAAVQKSAVGRSSASGHDAQLGPGGPAELVDRRPAGLEIGRPSARSPRSDRPRRRAPRRRDCRRTPAPRPAPAAAGSRPCQAASQSASSSSRPSAPGGLVSSLWRAAAAAAAAASGGGSCPSRARRSCRLSIGFAAVIGVGARILQARAAAMVRETIDEGKAALQFLTRLPVPGPAPQPAGRSPRARPGSRWSARWSGRSARSPSRSRAGSGCRRRSPRCSRSRPRSSLTGGLHEDGLADLADGLGGGRTRAERLAIMRDPRLGSFGALALILAVLARILALAALAEPALVAAALIAAGAVSRAALPALMAALPAARADGLAAAAGRPHPLRAAAAIAIAALAGFWAAAGGRGGGRAAGGAGRRVGSGAARAPPARRPDRRRARRRPAAERGQFRPECAPGASLRLRSALTRWGRLLCNGAGIHLQSKIESDQGAT